MYHKNELLFSNAFLNARTPNKDEIEAAYALMRSARTWFQKHRLCLIKTYNLLNNPDFQDEDIRRMRTFYSQMDQAILSCYGWEYIDLQHYFYPNDRKKIRFIPGPQAQREIFMRLMDLNQLIAAEEVSHGPSPAAGAEDEEEPAE